MSRRQPRGTQPVRRHVAAYSEGLARQYVYDSFLDSTRSES
ncbi:hypothetical protein SBRY_100060 [Actinacidiphila bryophytorum]|uniref:Uncharacterized protein n=1 Tax=Actinacidiphila bryophytorum TaxID=1436133 RepID=A0A9W4E390_9ACTN|nr:hypothetical protein SBRY_100060 [Actinacidiphila bryophytorum]